MAKISTYSTDSIVSGGDMLIGTDVDNNNATKNFTVSDLSTYITSTLTNFVPYTGATGDVNLGPNSIIVGNDVIVGDAVSIGGNLSVVTGATLLGGTLNITGATTLGDIDINGLFMISGSSGTVGQLLTSAGAGNPPQWTNPLTAYVPYTGATTNVDLGAYNLTADYITVNEIYLTGPFFAADGVEGTLNQVLASQGVGLPPKWKNPSDVFTGVFVPYSGASSDVNLGGNMISATGVDVKTGPLFANGDAGTSGYLLKSNGPLTNPTWVDVSATYVPYTGATANVDIGLYGFTSGAVTTDQVLLNGPLYLNGPLFDSSINAGTSNQVLISQGPLVSPIWATLPVVTKRSASFYSDVTQTPAAATDTPVRYNQIRISNADITVVNDGSGNPTKITFAVGGTYLVQSTIQAYKITGGNDEFLYGWISVNGSNQIYTSNRITLKDTGHRSVLTQQWLVTVSNGDHVQVYCHQTNAISLQADSGAPNSVASSTIVVQEM
jgi:hypothetical protein